MFIKNLFKRRRDKMSTLDEVRKAYEDLSDDDKKAFHQSIADRIHESIGEQETESGTKDSQTDADREHEALGEEHAEGKGETEELGKTDPEEKAEEAHEKAQEATNDSQNAALNAILARLDKLEEVTEKLASADKLDDARAKYGLSPKGPAETASKTFSDADINKLLD